MTPSDRKAAERARVRAEYRRRDVDETIRSRYRPSAPWVAVEGDRLEAAMRELLGGAGLLPLGGKRVLEVGCGSGAQLQRLVRLGADAERTCGVDLSRERLARARTTAPNAPLVEADAAELPFEDRAFDLVTQFTTLSSVLDPDVRHAAAREMSRVLARDGAILSYDVRMTAPRSRLVRIDRAEIARLFPGARAEIRTITLAPPLARALTARAPRVAQLLGRVAMLRTHHLVLVRPTG